MHEKKIYTFYYSGWNNTGQRLHAYIHAQHPLMAKNYLALQGILIKHLFKKPFSTPLVLPAKELLMITQQLALLINAALPMVFCLNTLAKQFKFELQILLKQMVFFIEQGQSLSTALHYFSPLFPHYFIHLIQVGEESGQLGTVLNQLAQYQEKMLNHYQQVKKALLYPAVVVGTSGMITLALLLWIVPQFQLLFSDMHDELPWMTQCVFALSSHLQQWQLQHVLILLLIVALIYRLRHHAYFIQCQQSVIYYLPWLGTLIHAQQQIRYLRSLALALQAGLPLLQGLQLASSAIHTSRLASKMTTVIPDVQSGITLAQSLQQSTQFDEIVIQLITLGEQTGQLAMLLMQAAALVEQHLEQRLQQLTRLLQPILVIVLGIILGSLIIALYMPVFKLGTLY